MSETTGHSNGERSFEERVFARFDAVDENLRSLGSRVESLDSRVQSLDARVESLDSRVGSLDSRVQVLESRAYDTKPIWEKALKEIADTRYALNDFKREVTERLDQIQMVVLETRVGLRRAHERIDDLESKA